MILVVFLICAPHTHPHSSILVTNATTPTPPATTTFFSSSYPHATTASTSAATKRKSSASTSTSTSSSAAVSSSASKRSKNDSTTSSSSNPTSISNDQSSSYITYRVCLPKDNSTTASLSSKERVKRLFNTSNNLNTRKKNETEDKIVVVLELPSGGNIDRWVVEDSTLTIVLVKHPLMFSAEAIQIAGEDTGFIEDAPDSRRGILRYHACNEAVEAFKTSIIAASAESTKNALERKIEIELEDVVIPESVVEFTYCYDASEDNKMQCVFAYFEFNVGTKTETDSYIKSSAVSFYGDNNNNNNNNAPSNNNNNNNRSTSASNNSSSSSSSRSSSNHNNTNHQSNSSARTSSSSRQTNENDTNSHHSHQNSSTTSAHSASNNLENSEDVTMTEGDEEKEELYARLEAKLREDFEMELELRLKQQKEESSREHRAERSKLLKQVNDQLKSYKKRARENYQKEYSNILNEKKKSWELEKEELIKAAHIEIASIPS